MKSQIKRQRGKPVWVKKDLAQKKEELMGREQTEELESKYVNRLDQYWSMVRDAKISVVPLGYNCVCLVLSESQIDKSPEIGRIDMLIKREDLFRDNLGEWMRNLLDQFHQNRIEFEKRNEAARSAGKVKKMNSLTIIRD